MRRKFIAFCSCCLLIFFGFSIISSAYYPVVTVNSGDWEISSDYPLESVVYPKWSTNPAFLWHDLYDGHDNLNGETVYTATDWYDDTYEVTVNITLPDLPYESNDWDGSAVFIYNDMFVLVHTWDSEYIYPTMDSTDHLGVYNGIEGLCDVYTMSYPYEEWTFLLTWDTMDWVGRTTTFGTLYDYSVSYVWSDMPVYRYTTANGCTPLYSASSSSITSVSSDITYEEPTMYLQGAATVKLSSGDVERLRAGAYCLRIQNFGIVCGTRCSYVVAHIGYSLLLNGEVVAGGSFFDDNSVSGVTTFGVSSVNWLEPQEARFYSNLVTFCDLDRSPSDGESYELRLVFMFAANGYLCFCPGTFELIEFESYDSDIKHEEMQSAIYEAADIVKGSVDSAKSEISSEIAEAAGNITSSIDNGTNAITGQIAEESKSIREKIGDAADALKQKFQDVGNEIKDKVQEVGDAIETKLEDVKNKLLEGIKDFFIPDEEAMTAIKDDWDALFAERFGALYQVSQIIQDFAAKLKYSGEKGTITFPAVTLNFSGTDFTFGGYEVDLVPDKKLEILTTTLKVITSIACTFLFINALRRKYDQLVGEPE